MKFFPSNYCFIISKVKSHHQGVPPSATLATIGSFIHIFSTQSSNLNFHHQYPVILVFVLPPKYLFISPLSPAQSTSTPEKVICLARGSARWCKISICISWSSSDDGCGIARCCDQCLGVRPSYYKNQGISYHCRWRTRIYFPSRIQRISNSPTHSIFCSFLALAFCQNRPRSPHLL